MSHNRLNTLQVVMRGLRWPSEPCGGALLGLLGTFDGGFTQVTFSLALSLDPKPSVDLLLKLAVEQSSWVSR